MLLAFILFMSLFVSLSTVVVDAMNKFQIELDGDKCRPPKAAAVTLTVAIAAGFVSD